jgi:hypothetical protein
MLLADNYALGRKTSPTTASAFEERKILTAPSPAKSRKKPRALITGGLTPRLLAMRKAAGAFSDEGCTQDDSIG